MEHTRVNFVLGHHQEQASVVCCQRGETTLLVTDLTPFHPQSHLWPDQPGDVGHARWEGGEAAIGPCRMGAISPDGELFVDADIPVKRGAEGWRFVVVHPLAGEHSLPVGSRVELQVDNAARHALSLGHSGCHLAALALNRTLTPYWRKEVSERDALGQPDFDRLAIQSSRVEPCGSREQYRIGKSLRKKGVNSEALLADLAVIEEKVNQQLADWIAAGGEIRRSRAGEAIIDSRYWHCTLEGQEVTIPCGGTHVTSLAELGEVKVTLNPAEEGFTLHTQVTAPAA
ncbi:alanyl-tRNA editing protein [Aeromonas jandaei]